MAHTTDTSNSPINVVPAYRAFIEEKFEIGHEVSNDWFWDAFGIIKPSDDTPTGTKRAAEAGFRQHMNALVDMLRERDLIAIDRAPGGGGRVLRDIVEKPLYWAESSRLVRHKPLFTFMANEDGYTRIEYTKEDFGSEDYLLIIKLLESTVANMRKGISSKYGMNISVEDLEELEKAFEWPRAKKARLAKVSLGRSVKHDQEMAALLGG